MLKQILTGGWSGRDNFVWRDAIIAEAVQMLGQQPLCGCAFVRHQTEIESVVDKPVRVLGLVTGSIS